MLVTGADLVFPARRRLEAIGAAVDLMDGAIDEDRLAGEIAGRPTQAVLMRGNPPLTRRVIEAAPELRVIAKHGAGTDSVDLRAATERGVLVLTAGDANAPAVAEMTMALLLTLRREIIRADRSVKEGRWERSSYAAPELSGQTLGIVGLGRIGCRVALLAGAFGMRVIAAARPGSAPDPALSVMTMPFDALLAEADVVSLHCPLTPLTSGLMNADALARMKPGALLINTARGGLVDEVALAAALQEGRLGGAALDTLSGEPPRPDNPLLTAPNVVLTPHVAGQTSGSIERAGIRAAENIVAVLTGGAVDAGHLVNGPVSAPTLGSG